MRIVHVNFSFTVGGIETMLVDIMRLQSQAHKVYLVIINDEYDSDLLKTIPPCVKVILVRRRRGARGVIGAAKIIYLNMLIRAIRPDIIHCHTHNVGSVIFGLKGRMLLTLHDVGCDLSLCDKYSRVYAISKAVNDDSVARGFGSLAVIENGVDVAKIACKARLFDGTFRIVQVSRLMHEKKGQDLLIKALNEIVNTFAVVNVNVDFIGAGPSIDYLKNMVQGYGLGSYVSFLGSRDRDYVYDHLCDYDLLVQPSRYEGFGLTVAEGMAAGVSVLVSNIQGPLEIIDNGRYGTEFRCGDHIDLAKKIISLMGCENRAVLVAAAKERVIDNYDISRTVDRYLVAYRDVSR